MTHPAINLRDNSIVTMVTVGLILLIVGLIGACAFEISALNPDESAHNGEHYPKGSTGAGVAGRGGDARNASENTRPANSLPGYETAIAGVARLNARDARMSPTTAPNSAGLRNHLVTDRLLDAIARVESNGRHGKILGDNGRSRGAFQLSASAWTDVNTLRARKGLVKRPYSLAFDPSVSREFASIYLRWLNAELTAALKREPKPAELFASWNLGLTGFKRRGFSLGRCPVVTRSKARYVEGML